MKDREKIKLLKKPKKQKRKRKVVPSPLIKNLLEKSESSIVKETEYIIGRAQEYDPRVVAWGPLILFSTDTGDSWVLDPNDSLALCLSRGGERKNFTIFETASNFQIKWNATYQIAQDKFIVQFDSGEIRTILGYPVDKINSFAVYAKNDLSSN